MWPSTSTTGPVSSCWATYGRHAYYPESQQKIQKEQVPIRCCLNIKVVLLISAEVMNCTFMRRIYPYMSAIDCSDDVRQSRQVTKCLYGSCCFRHCFWEMYIFILQFIQSSHNVLDCLDYGRFADIKYWSNAHVRIAMGKSIHS